MYEYESSVCGNKNRKWHGIRNKEVNMQIEREIKKKKEGRQWRNNKDVRIGKDWIQQELRETKDKRRKFDQREKAKGKENKKKRQKRRNGK